MKVSIAFILLIAVELASASLSKQEIEQCNQIFGDRGKISHYPKNETMFLSQYGQDKWILENVFIPLGIKKGNFLEFGARDGLEYSNSYYFEKYMDWGGLLAEPSNEYFDIESLRKPSSKVKALHGGFCIPTGVREYISVIGGSHKGWKGRSGFKDKLEELGYYQYLVQQSQIPENKIKLESFNITCFDLKEELGKANIKELHLFSADCEGCEFDVLHQFDFNAFPVTVLMHEHLPSQPQQQCKLYKYLKQKGFTLVNRATTDFIYVNSKYIEKLNLNTVV